MGPCVIGAAIISNSAVTFLESSAAAATAAETPVAPGLLPLVLFSRALNLRYRAIALGEDICRARSAQAAASVRRSPRSRAANTEDEEEEEEIEAGGDVNDDEAAEAAVEVV